MRSIKLAKKALEETAEALLEGLRAALSSREEEVEHLENMNKELSLFVDELVQGRHFDCGRKTLAESGRSAVYTKLKALKARAQVALKFAEALGVDVRALVFTDKQSGRQSYLDLDDSFHTVFEHGLPLPTAPHMYIASASQTASPPQKIRLSESPRLEAALATRDGSCAETCQWQALSPWRFGRGGCLLFVCHMDAR